MRIPDNYDLCERHNAQQERELARFPECTSCFQPITDDKACVLDGEWWHTYCFIDHFERPIDEYFD